MRLDFCLWIVVCDMSKVNCQVFVLRELLGLGAGHEVCGLLGGEEAGYLLSWLYKVK